jgi:hypothetical protein
VATADKDIGDQSSEEPAPVPVIEEPASLCGTPAALCSPGEKVACSAQANVSGGGNAVCREDCTGWDRAACDQEGDGPYGLLSMSLSVDFILDAARLGEAGYAASHADTIVRDQPAFAGHLGGGELPPSDAVDYEIWTVRSEDPEGATMSVVQQAFDGNGRLVNPVVELRLPRDDFAAGQPASICLGQGIVFYIYDLNPDFSGIACFHAISGDATMEVQRAEGLTGREGGELSLAAADVPMHYVRETHHGDVTSSLPCGACQKLD